MIYQLRDKKQILKKKKIIKNLIIFIIIILLFVFGVISWSSNIFYNIGLPIWQGKKIISSGVDGANYLIISKKSIFRENENLKKENDDLKISMLDYQILKKENDDLKELLNRKQLDYNFILANILSKPNKSPYDTLLIDIGLKDGISENNMVYANGNIPIGVVEKLENNLSLVSLFTNPGRKTEGIIEGFNFNIELIGRGGGNFEVSLPVEIEIQEGIKVLLPSLNPEIIATVVGIISKPNDPIKKVILTSPVNVQNLKWVEVKID